MTNTINPVIRILILVMFSYRSDFSPYKLGKYYEIAHSRSKKNTF
jgi:hypothetical protein